MTKRLPSTKFFLKQPIPGEPNFTIEQYVRSGSNAHVFRAYSKRLNATWAAKIIPRCNLRISQGDPEIWMHEPKKANALESPAVVKCHSVTEWKHPAKKIDCVVLCYDYIEGESLRDYIANNRDKITMRFIEDCLETLLDLFNEMKGKAILHGDLHSGNILVQQSRFRLLQRIVFRVTDFGVGLVTGDLKARDDYDQLAGVLKELLENVDYQASSARDKYSFNILNNDFLARHLYERDTTHDPYARKPDLLFQKLSEIDANFASIESAAQQVTLRTPFDYLNCEQIGDAHSLLNTLYSDSFLGLQSIEEKNNLVLTGPRGCGKTTVFRSLSLKHRASVNNDGPEGLNYIGIYYRCEDLYFAFPRYNIPSNRKCLDIPIHFITATLTIDILESLRLWCSKHFSEGFAHEESQVATKLWALLELEKPNEPGAESFRALADALRRERKLAVQYYRNPRKLQKAKNLFWGPGVFLSVCKTIQQGLSCVRSRPLYIFIDDYSSPKITFALQKSLNRLLMQRSSYCFFKISTESPVSYVRADLDGKNYPEGREFKLLNLGLVFLHEDTGAKLRFIQDVFAKRFAAIANYPVSSLQQLVGSNPEANQNEIARELRQGKPLSIWGEEALGALCSGDIHYILSLVGKMVAGCGGQKGLSQATGEFKVSATDQTKAIRKEAGDFLISLRSIDTNGPHLVEIVSAFGAVAHSYLQFRDSRNEAGNPPHQASRIEPLEDVRLSPEAKTLYDQLLMYSIFIEDPRGKSRREKVVPRLFLRRFLIPHFNLTFSTRDSLELEATEVQQLILNPSDFEKTHRLKDVRDQDQGYLY